VVNSKHHAVLGEKDAPSHAQPAAIIAASAPSSYRRHSMDYVDPGQIASETGYTDKRDWYLLILKELMDNPIDFLQTNYKGSMNEKITIRIAIDAERSLFHYKITNTNSNPKEYPVFEDLKDILDFEMRYGSKQNDYRILMGTLGDAMKRIAAFGHVFAQADNQGIDSKGKDWNEPIIYKANGLLEHKVWVRVDSLEQEVKADIQTTTKKHRSDNTETTIESTIPLIAQVKNDRYFLGKLAEYCCKRVAFITDISFDIEITDSRFEGAWTLQTNALHSINAKWNNLSSVYYYTPKQFADRFRDVFDKQKTSVYQVLKTFRETTQISRVKFLSELDLDVDLSIEQFLQKYGADYDKKTDHLYYYLRDALPPATELSLPYYAPPEISRQMRTETLAQRITKAFDPQGTKYDATRAVYRIVRGEDIRTIKGLSPDGSGDLEIRYPYTVEIIAIPINRTYLYTIPDRDLPKEKCKFIGAINNCVSPKDTKFRDFGRHRYGWLTREDDPQMEEIEADDIEDVLAAAGFPFPTFEIKPRTKIPCIVAINLTSTKLEYIGTSKTDIEVGPYTAAITKAVESVAKEKGVIRTYKGVGIQISNKGKVTDVNKRPEGKQETKVADVIEMLPLIKNRLQQVKEAKALNRLLPKFDERTQDSIWYNCLPLWENERYGNVPKPTRDHFKVEIDTMCSRNKVTREELGIIASPWAAIYYEGIWRLVSYDAIIELAKKGVSLVFIEKRDIVQSLGPYAFDDGVALVNSRGFLVEYAKKLAEAARKGRAHIFIMTDYDTAGILIAYEMPDAIWLGCDERMLKKFGIKHNNKNYAIDYTPNKARTNEYDLQQILKHDKRFAHVDVDFIRKKRIDGMVVEGKRVELDAVLARASEQEYGGSPKVLWDYIKELIDDAAPIQDYNRAVQSKSPTLSNHYPKPYRQLTTFVEQFIDNIIAPTKERIESELRKTVGLTNVEELKEYVDKEEGKIITDNKLLKKLGMAIKEIDKKYKFGIAKTKLLEEEGEGGGKKASNGPVKQHAVSSEIPDPPPLLEDEKPIAGLDPLTYAKMKVIFEYCDEMGPVVKKEIMDKVDAEGGCRHAIDNSYKDVMMRKQAKEILQQRQRQPRIKQQKEEEIKHTFPYPGLPDEERVKELHEDQKYMHEILSNGPDRDAELRLSQVEHELHKLYERGIGGYIAGSEHDPDREWYLQQGAANAVKEEEEEKQ
jgi:hypothetical protein